MIGVCMGGYGVSYFFEKGGKIIERTACADRHIA